MERIDNLMEVCRLCLVKEQVNVPIFEENGQVRQISTKINSCLPVKVTLEDNLPKKICGDCSYKLDMFYLFWNTSAESEQQLIAWLNGVNLKNEVTNKCTNNDTNTIQCNNNSKKLETVVKQEAIDGLDIGSAGEYSNDELSADNFVLNPKQLDEDIVKNTTEKSTNRPVDEEDDDDGRPPSKRPRRSVKNKKPPPPIDSEEDDEDEEDEEDDDEDNGSFEAVTKKEGQSDDSEDGDLSNQKDTNSGYDDGPSTTNTEGQPGPSGVSKAPTEPTSIYQEALYNPATAYNSLENLQNNSLQMQCKYFMSIVDGKSDTTFDKSVVEQLNETEAEILNLLTTQDGCADILNNIATDLIGSETEFSGTDILPPLTYKCFQCNKECKTKKLLRKHLLIHSTNKQFPCEICGNKFKFRYQVTAHRKIHEKPTFQCDICPKMFVHKSHLTVHRRKHLGENVAFCKLCNLSFVTNSAYKTHNDVHHKNLRLICDVCGANLSSSSSLKEHKLTHESGYGMERTHICEICGRTYLNERNLKSHKRTHSNPRNYICGICGKSVSSKSVLETHVKMHTGVKDFHCNVCNKQFASKEYLMVHQRIHTGNKPHVCTFCGKRFTQKTTLTVHLRGHTGQKPYKCECGKGFTTKSHLMSHYKTHDVGGVDIEYISHPLA